jgi:hypothetical protein
MYIVNKNQLKTWQARFMSYVEASLYWFGVGFETPLAETAKHSPQRIFLMRRFKYASTTTTKNSTQD